MKTIFQAGAVVADKACMKEAAGRDPQRPHERMAVNQEAPT